VATDDSTIAQDGTPDQAEDPAGPQGDDPHSRKYQLDAEDQPLEEAGYGYGV
jgi:hypothetical protein